ncbi:MAG: NYN domain-containing protein [Bauldia sp.]
MVRAVKSVLFFDYDSMHRVLLRHGPAIADFIGSRAGTWVEAIESGELLTPPPEEGRRRFVVKRCYADPRLLGKNRGWISANGLQIVDCSVPPGLERSAAAVHVSLDALDPGDAAVDEIVIMMAEMDLSPLISRLRGLSRRVVIFAAEGTPDSYTALADAVVTEARLVSALSRSNQADAGRNGIPRPPRLTASPVPSAPAPQAIESPPPAAANPEPPRMPPQRAATPSRAAPPPRRAALPARRSAIDRDELAALVRRIHQSTNVPLFSPKAFGDLFRLLVEDVRTNGYRFQATADNVAAAMNALGRNVTKRQVGFVIKGLALRGHVFNENDRPEDLADAFYAQVLFLAESSNLNLTEGEKNLVQAWVVGLRREEPATPTPAPAAPRAASAAGRMPPASRRKEAEPLVTPPPPPRPASRTVEPPRPQRMPDPPPTLAAGRVRAATRAAEEREALRRAAEEREAARRAEEEIEAARLADEEALREATRAATARPTPRSVLAQRTAQNGVAMPERRTSTAGPVEARPEADLEDSILSAIADAVDVLVEDEVGPRAAARSGGDAPAVRPPPPPSDDDEIGDEIQRILSTFSRNR